MNPLPRVVIILNGISRRKKYFYSKILPLIKPHANVEVHETQSNLDATTLASTAVDKGAEILIAAGGDGTLNQVVNGVLQGRDKVRSLPTLGLLPLGSANDFARTLNLTDNPNLFADLLKRNAPNPVDAGKCIFQNKDQKTGTYFINIADTGMGPYVAERINKGNRNLPPGLVYYTAILKTFFTYKPRDVSINTEDWSWTGKIRSLAIANGKFFGHGLCIAPDANVGDGIFSISIVEDVSVLDFIRYSETLKKGKYVDHPKVHYRQATEIELSSSEDFMMEADGELMTLLPVRVKMLPNRLYFLY